LPPLNADRTVTPASSNLLQRPEMEFERLQRFRLDNPSLFFSMPSAEEPQSVSSEEQRQSGHASKDAKATEPCETLLYWH
jgi:hypothetical protein